MATNTPNYNLIKPDQTDFYDIADFNANADIIDGTVKGIDNRVTRIEATPEWQITLPAAGWSGTIPYTQTVAVNGLDESHVIIYDLDISSAAAAEEEQKQWTLIGQMDYTTNSAKFTCFGDKPTVNLIVRIASVARKAVS